MSWLNPGVSGSGMVDVPFEPAVAAGVGSTLVGRCSNGVCSDDQREPGTTCLLFAECQAGGRMTSSSAPGFLTQGVSETRCFRGFLFAASLISHLSHQHGAFDSRLRRLTPDKDLHNGRPRTTAIAHDPRQRSRQEGGPAQTSTKGRVQLCRVSWTYFAPTGISRLRAVDLGKAACCRRLLQSSNQDPRAQIRCP